MPISTAKEQAVVRSLTQIMRNKARMVKMFWPEIAMKVPSDGEGENYAWLNSMPRMKKFLGDRIFEELRASTYTLINQHWESSVGLDRIKVQDDQYGFFSNVAAALAEEAKRQPDDLLVQLIVNAETEICYDGQPFFDTDHAEGKSGTQSNLLEFEVVNRDDIQFREFRRAFHRALKQMFLYKNDRGEQIVKPRISTEGMGLKLLVPISLWEVADEAMTITLREGGASAHLLQKAEVIPVAGMGSESEDGDDYVMDLVYTGNQMKPYVYQDRMPLRFMSKGAEDIEEKLIKMMTESRNNVGFGLWQMAVRTRFGNE